jgi:hypothetical protein
MLMSSGPKTRKSTGPTSPRGIYSRSVAAPGMSLDMPDEKPVKKMAVGGPSGGMNVRKDKGSFAEKRAGTLRTVPAPVPIDRGYKKGGSVKSSASKRADGCAVRGKTKGRMV